MRRERSGLGRVPSRRVRPYVVCSAMLVSALSLRAQVPQPAEPVAALPDRVEIDARAAAIGKRLFSDVRLSRNLEQSCATCHPLDGGGMDGARRATLADGRPHLRNTPTVFNVGFNASYNWDGLVATLEEHTERTLGTLMRMTWPELLTRLRRDPEYASRFRAAFPDGITRDTVLRAITSFERSLVTPRSRFDRYLQGDRGALTTRERQGYELFKRHGCVSCHQGVNIGGNIAQKFGVFQDMMAQGAPAIDLGRGLATGVPRDAHVFRVPSLRNVAATAPYFHDGRQPRLDAAVETMAKAQLGRRLESGEIERLVEFLGTLTGEYRGRPLTAAQTRSH